MRMYALRCETLIKMPLRETFDFFKNPANLAKITPSWLNFQILSSDLDMRKGAQFDYVIRWLGLPMKWRSTITEYDPPFAFADEQVKGPYASWHHRHTFTETSRGIIVGDRVDYSLPLGPLGAIAHAVMVKAQLEQTFQYRGAALARIFKDKTELISGPAICLKSTLRSELPHKHS